MEEEVEGAPIDAMALTCASIRGRLDIVKYLFEKGAPIDTEAINWASFLGHLEIVKYLCEKEDDPISDERALCYAKSGGQTEVIKYLLFINASRPKNNSKISVIIEEVRKYRNELLPILEYKFGHPSCILLDYLQYDI
jgi:ankyrin repeat protein